MNMDNISQKSRKKIIRLGIAAIVALLALYGIVAGISSLTPYNRQVRKAYTLLKNNQAEDALHAFSDAIEMKENKPKAYIGKAEALSVLEPIDVNRGKQIVQTLHQGFEKSRSRKIKKGYKSIAKDLKKRGNTEVSKLILEAYEQIKHNKNTGEFEITGYRFAIEPYLDADTVDVIVASNKHLYSEVSMIQKNGFWGLIDYTGKQVASPEYDKIEAGMEGKIVLSKGKAYYTYENGNIKTVSYKDVMEPSDSDVLVWDRKREGISLVDSDGRAEKYAYEGLFAARGATPRGSKTQEDGYITYENYTKNYAVISNNKRCSDFIYDFALSENEGLMPVRRGGKWGYVNQEGKEVIPCIYEGVNQKGMYQNDDSVKDVAYVPTCQTIAVKKDGKWGYIDLNGHEITGFIFEEARPLYEKKAWVKHQGKWGVIEFGHYQNGTY